MIIAVCALDPQMVLASFLASQRPAQTCFECYLRQHPVVFALEIWSVLANQKDLAERAHLQVLTLRCEFQVALWGVNPTIRQKA